MDSLETLFEATLATSVAVLLVLAMRRPLRAAFGARVAYGAWVLVPASLVAVLLPAAALAPGNNPVLAMPRALPLLVAVPDAGVVDPRLLLAVAWLAGCMACAGWMALRQRRFRSSLGRLSPRADGIRESERDIEGLPATLGVWSPQIVVPPTFDARYDPAQRELILAHERAHVLRGDVHANVVGAGLRCLFWFNPLLHFAAPRFRQDQELACDATVLAHHPASRRRYGDALLQAQLVAQATPLGCHFGFGHPLKERIAMLREQLPSTSRRVLGTALTSIFVFGLGFAAWAAQPQGEAAQGGERDIKTIATPPPKYPGYAFEHNLEGLVVMRVDVAADGSVTGALVERAEPKGIFEEAALAAVKNWKFTPAMKNGKAIAGQVRVPIEFALDPKEGEESKPMKVGPGHDPDPAAYDWIKLDMSSTVVTGVECDVLKGDIEEGTAFCGKHRR